MRKKNMGIYIILNTINNKFYIGSSSDINKRESAHFSNLNKGVHINKHLQSAFNKYGEQSFYFGVIEVVDDQNELLNREQFWIDFFDVCNPKVGYNIALFAKSPNKGLKHTEEAKQAIGNATRGRKPTEKQLQVARENGLKSKGRTLSEKHKNKISEWSRKNIKRGSNSHMFGTHLSDETKNKISKKKKGVTPKNLDYLHSEEVKKRQYDGVMNGANVKLNPDKVREIKKLLSDGIESIKSIAEIFNVSVCAIYDIKAGRSWSNVLI